MIRKSYGFTIVELLVVIVVIGVLAAITVVSYTGLTNKAVLASLQSDLSNASTKLKAYQTLYGSYPTLDVNNCPTAPTVDNNYCLKFSPGNTLATAPFSGYVPSNTTNPQTFSLTLSSNGINGVITDSSKPAILTPAPLSPVADWIATPTGDHYGNYYDSVTKTWATVTRTTPKTIYDPATQHIYDVPAGKLAVNPRSDGKSGSEAVIEEGRTNYITNSYGAANTGGGWNDKYYSMPFCNGAAEWSISDGIYSSSAQRLRYTGVEGDTAGQSQFAQPEVVGIFSEGQSAVGSFYAKASLSSGVSAYLYVQALGLSGYINTVSTAIPNDGLWHRIVAVFSPLPTGTTRISTRLQVNGITEGRSIDITIDAVQVEKGAFATSYIPTTTTTETRNADIVTVPTTNWSGVNGTWVTHSSPIPSNSDNGVPHALWTWWKDGGNFLYSYVANGATYVAASASSNATMGDIISTSKIVHTTVSRYDAGQPIRLFMDGVAGTGTNIHNSTTGLPSTAAIGSLYNAGISRLTVYSSALSDTNVLSVTNAVKDGL